LADSILVFGIVGAQGIEIGGARGPNGL